MAIDSQSVIRFAQEDDLLDIKALADANQHELGFVIRGIIEEAIRKKEIIYIPNQGFLHFHLRRDHVSTLYHLCVSTEFRKQGVGRRLINEWEKYCNKPQVGIKKLRLKCPADLEANGFYFHLGFIRAEIERGKKRSLIVWEKELIAAIAREAFMAKLSEAGG
jgi:ribosomal protein S18 acetylase RimI-like enzyme